jgi:hypothetical protein
MIAWLFIFNSDWLRLDPSLGMAAGLAQVVIALRFLGFV